MLVNTSPRSAHSISSLREVIITVSGNRVEGACASVPLLGSGLAANGISEEHEQCSLLGDNLNNFSQSIELGDS